MLVKTDAYQCDRCGWIWLPKESGKRPVRCAKCRSPYWNSGPAKRMSRAALAQEVEPSPDKRERAGSIPAGGTKSKQEAKEPSFHSRICSSGERVSEKVIEHAANELEIAMLRNRIWIDRSGKKLACGECKVVEGEQHKPWCGAGDRLMRE